MCRQYVDTSRNSFCGQESKRLRITSLSSHWLELGHASSLHQCLPPACADLLPVSYLVGEVETRGHQKVGDLITKCPNQLCLRSQTGTPMPSSLPASCVEDREHQLPSPKASSSATKPAIMPILHSELYPGIKPSYTSPRLWHTLSKETNTSTFLKENHKCLMWLAFLLNQVRDSLSFCILEELVPNERRLLRSRGWLRPLWDPPGL